MRGTKTGTVGTATTEIGGGTGTGIVVGCVHQLDPRQIGTVEEEMSEIPNANCAVIIMNVASVREAVSAYLAMVRRLLLP